MVANSTAVKLCSDALGDDADVILSELNRGICQAIQLDGCVCIIRQEGKTMVVVAVQGKGIRRVIRKLYKGGKKAGFRYWRVHLADRRLALIVKKMFGYDNEGRDDHNYIILRGTF